MFPITFLFLCGVSSFYITIRTPNTQVRQYGTLMTEIIRPLGAYEKLLSRKTPQTNSASLSHGSVVYLNGGFSEKELLFSIQYCMSRHPMLRSYINDGDTKNPFWTYCAKPLDKLAAKVLKTINLEESEYEDHVKSGFESKLNNVEFPNEGPLWSLTQLQTKTNKKSIRTALLFCVNHGIDDQQSITIILNDIITACKLYRRTSDSTALQPPASLAFPSNVELAVAPEFPQLNTLFWTLFQLKNMLSFSKTIPNAVIKKVGEKNPPQEYVDPTKRRTIVELLTLNDGFTGKLRNICRERGVTVTHALAAAMICLTSNAIHGLQPTAAAAAAVPVSNDNNYRFLLSVGLRRFGAAPAAGDSSDWTGGTVACAGGAVDYVLSCTPLAVNYFNKLVEKEATENSDDVSSEGFWSLARNGQISAKEVMDQGFVPESVRLFGIGMQVVDVLQAVDIDAASKSTLGRGFSCGVSNVGLQEFEPTKDLNIEIESIFYGTSQNRNGVLIQLSSLTLADSGRLCGCLQFAEPIIARSQAKILRDRLSDFLCALVSSD